MHPESLLPAPGACSRRPVPHPSTPATVVALALAALATTPVQAQSAPASSALVVVVRGAASSDGVLLVALYDRPQAWLKPPQALQVLRVPPRPRVELRFENLAPGTYAVGVIHDVNRNDKLDFSFFPYPHIEEAAGMSNNPTSRIGPPSFADSSFAFAGGEQRLEIALQQ